MSKNTKRIIASFMVFFVAFICLNLYAYGKNTYEYEYKNKSTGYRAVLIDNADYLSESEEKKVFEIMKEITDKTNVCFLTDDNNDYYSESYSENLCKSTLKEVFGAKEDSVIYLIDNEYDYIYAMNDTFDVITSKKAYSITDNVYKYSAKGEYDEAAIEAFNEINALLNGEKIAQSMKYISNAFMSVFIACFLSYFITSKNSKITAASNKEMVEGALYKVNVDSVNVIHVSTEKVYSPQSSGGGGGHGGGGHGGGGHGGGGGHSH